MLIFRERLIRALLLGQDLNRRLDVVMQWVHDHIREGETLHIKFEKYDRYVHFPTPIGSSRPRFSRTPIGLLAFRVSDSEIFDAESWQPIFKQSGFNFFEAKHRFQHDPPVRWGLSQDQKRKILEIAHETITKYILQESLVHIEHSMLPFWLRRKANVDITLWVNGDLRGSCVSVEKPLYEGIQRAARDACLDVRFKPISKKELPSVQIEATIMGDLMVPLLQNEVGAIVHPDKGYYLKAGDRQGWLLPLAFNSASIPDAKNFYEILLHEKANVSHDNLDKPSIYTVEVQDFVEYNEHEVHSMRSSMLAVESGLNREGMLTMLCLAGDWLVNIQHDDGSFVTHIHPFDSPRMDIDWTRSAFASWALLQLGNHLTNETYRNASERSYSFLKEYLYRTNMIPEQKRFLALVYFGKLLNEMGKDDEIHRVVHEITPHMKRIRQDPISLSQAVGLFRLEIFGNEFEKLIRDALASLKAAFKDKQVAMRYSEPALWAELGNAFRGFDNDFAQEVVRWLESFQLGDGSFRTNAKVANSNTRGTGKILEILVLDYRNNPKVFDRGLSWLASMQYTESNSFFIPPNIAPKIIGGFRDSYMNPGAWIDGAGHAILAGLRRLQND